MKCQTKGNSPKGYGGRLADKLNNIGYIAETFSVSGTKIFTDGKRARGKILDSAVTPISGLVSEETFNNILKWQHQNIYCEEYAQLLNESIQETEDFIEILDKAKLNTTYPEGSKLSNKLRQIARLISLRGERGVNRDIFYVATGGF